MDQIFERLENLLRSMFQETEKPSGSTRFSDPDMADAWEELDDFLKSDNPKNSGSRSSYGSGDRSSQREGSYYSTADPKEELRQDFANLEVPFGASFEAVKKSYRELLRKYHPDKHSGDPGKQKNATEITQRLNNSYHKIKAYYDKTKKP